MILLKKKRITPFLQFSCAVVYILFGLLKFGGWSPAEQLIFDLAQALPYVEFERFYPLLGGWEVLLWIVFLKLSRFRQRWFWLFLAHMLGTFLPFVIIPESCLGVCEVWLRHPTFTMFGQYIVKNFSLIGCGVVLKYSTETQREGNSI